MGETGNKGYRDQIIEEGVNHIQKGVEMLMSVEPMYDLRNVDVRIRVPGDPAVVAALLRRGWRLKEDGYMHNRPFKRMSPKKEETDNEPNDMDL